MSHCFFIVPPFWLRKLSFSASQITGELGKGEDCPLGGRLWWQRSSGRRLDRWDSYTGFKSPPPHSCRPDGTVAAEQHTGRLLTAYPGCQRKAPPGSTCLAEGLGEDEKGKVQMAQCPSCHHGIRDPTGNSYCLRGAPSPRWVCWEKRLSQLLRVGVAMPGVPLSSENFSVWITWRGQVMGLPGPGPGPLPTKP